jgi:hypothetical protein
MKGKVLTLAQFKRDAKTGHMGLELVERYGKKENKRQIVPVVKVQAEGVVLKRDNKESYLDIPFASLVEYTGETLKVYDMGKRPLNDLELRVLNEWRKIENTKEYIERARIDVLTDSSLTYYREKKFFESSPCPYLFISSKRFRYNKGDTFIYDAQVKGKCILKYNVHKI